MDSSASSILLSIIAYARSGAQEKAWAMFRDAGFERVKNDPAILSVKGRLLKDRGIAAKGGERRCFYREAATAYRRAGEIGGANYPLINAATLSLLAGQQAQSRTLARQILGRTRQGSEEPETAYWRAATSAEAQLLIGEVAQAKITLQKAMALAPRAYEDHASTLRQFCLILEELGEDKSWLDALRPPRSLHFAGHMELAGDRATIHEIREWIKKERIGFGYGALGAGADILIAEALLEAGAELHVVLPGRAAQFREISVARFGRSWVRRFDEILAAASSVRTIGRDDPISPLAIRLAAEVAMGCAAMHAGALTTEAVQLLILDRGRKRGQDAGVSSLISATWKKSGRRRHSLAAPSVRNRSAGKVDFHRTSSSETLAAMLRIEVSDYSDATMLKRLLSRLAKVLATGEEPLASPRWTGAGVFVAFDTAATAADAALAITTALGKIAALRIAGHYAIAQLIDDPFGGRPFLAGAEPALPRKVALSTPTGAIHVSESFAAALSAGSASEHPHTEFVGELPQDATVRLFSLRR